MATETPGALRSWSVPSGEPRRLLSSTPFQISSGECRFELDAVAEEDLHLPVEVEMPAVLGDGDLADQRRRDRAALDQTRRRFRLAPAYLDPCDGCASETGVGRAVCRR